MKRSLDQLAEIAQKAVSIGSSLIKNSRPTAVKMKADRDSYTNIDLTIEQRIREYLTRSTPEISFYGEESGGKLADDRYTWILDPVDGTANYVHGVPLSAVSLALTYRNTTLVGEVALPYLDLQYSAVKNSGSFVNGNRIKVSSTQDLSKAMVSIGDYAVGHGAEAKNRRRVSLTASLAHRVERIRMLGSAAHDLVWVAEGRLDAALILSNNSWDVAAGVLIAREAGALVLDSNGEQHDNFSSDTIAATPGIAIGLLTLIPAC